MSGEGEGVMVSQTAWYLFKSDFVIRRLATLLDSFTFNVDQYSKRANHPQELCSPVMDNEICIENRAEWQYFGQQKDPSF